MASGLYRWTVLQYDRMVQAGMIAAADRVELIEGLLVTKLGRNRPHVQAENKGFWALARIFGSEWHARKEDRVAVSQWSKPEPGLAVVRGVIADYDQRDVVAADVALVVEIADSSLPADQADMARVYAASGIPVYWIVNLVARQLEVYTNPGPTGYAKAATVKPGQDVPVVVNGFEVGRIAVADMLP